jgi:hypothetical protein
MLSNIEILHWVEYLINDASEKLDDGMLAATAVPGGLAITVYDPEDGETIVSRMLLEVS